MTAERVTLQGEGRKARTVIVDHAPVNDPVTEQAFARIRNRGMQKPQNVVTKLGKNSRKLLYESLEARARCDAARRSCSASSR